MAAVKKRGGWRSSFPADAIPELLASALAREDDLILTCETDHDSGQKTLHVITGKLVSPCMLNKLRARIGAYPEDGRMILLRRWKCDMRGYGGEDTAPYFTFHTG
jgi:hypothetical protein